MVSLFLLFSCDSASDGTTSEQVPPPAMDIDRLAARLSLDTIGRRPTEAELDALEADPSTLDTVLDTWMADPQFEERLVSLYAEVYRTRADHFVVGADGDADLTDITYKAQFQRSVGEEPPRFVAHVAALDRPWTDVVTADWSMANDELLTHFPMMEVEPVGYGWRAARYVDGRPAAGVLATNGMWWRYTSTVDNLNRGRAAALSRVLLCDRRYEATIDFQSNQSQDVTERITSDPACVACHITLDPIGSNLWGFWRHHPESYTEALRYYPSREQDWESHGVPAPAFYGTPTDGLYGLGRAIADDPRFGNCAVTQVWGFLLRREPTVDETDRFTADREAFIDGGLTFRSLYKSVADDPWYRSDSGDYEGTTPPRRLTPDQHASAIEALTGYRWTVEGGLDSMVNDDYGYRILDGGVDGVLVVDPPSTESAPVMLVQERLAELAGPFAVAQESEKAVADRILFLEQADLDAEPSEDEAKAQINGLARRILGKKLTEEETGSLYTLWGAVRAESGGPAEAWGHIVAALLRHPEFVMY